MTLTFNYLGFPNIPNRIEEIFLLSCVLILLHILIFQGPTEYMLITENDSMDFAYIKISKLKALERLSGYIVKIVVGNHKFLSHAD